MASVIGLVQGGVQAISRSYFSTLIPQNKAAEFLVSIILLASLLFLSDHLWFQV